MVFVFGRCQRRKLRFQQRGFLASLHDCILLPRRVTPASIPNQPMTFAKPPRGPLALLVPALLLALCGNAQAAKPAKGRSLCQSEQCSIALRQLNAALSSEVAAAGRTGAQLLLKQPNDGRYQGSKVNAQIGQVHARANSGSWYLLHGKRTPQGGVEVQGIYALKARPGKAATAEVDSMALQLGNPQRPDVQPLSTAVNALVKALPKGAAKTLPEGQLPKWLGGSSLVAVVGYDGSSPALAHFAVVPDVIDVRMTGTAMASGNAKAGAGSRNEVITPNNDPQAPKPVVVMASPPTSSASTGAVAAVDAKTGKPEKLRGQIISQRPGETIMLLSDEQGQPKSLRFDVDPVLLEKTQQDEAAGKR